MATTTIELQQSFRAPYATTGAASMAETLPVLNFGFDDLRARMNEFTQRFDEFIEQGRKRVMEERNQFRMNVANVQGMDYPTSQAAERAIEQANAMGVTSRSLTGSRKTRISSSKPTRACNSPFKICLACANSQLAVNRNNRDARNHCFFDSSPRQAPLCY